MHLSRSLFLVHLSRRLKCTIVIMRCPSSVRPSFLTFHIFDFSSETTEQNSTKLDRKQDLNVLYQVCVFRVDIIQIIPMFIEYWSIVYTYISIVPDAWAIYVIRRLYNVLIFY